MKSKTKDTKFVSHEELERREQQEKDDRQAKIVYYGILIAFGLILLAIAFTIYQIF